jgi:pyruvate carboxylase
VNIRPIRKKMKSRQRVQLLLRRWSAFSTVRRPRKTNHLLQKGQTLGVIEAMKLMNEIESECDGIVKEVLVENGEMVEFGQPLFIVGV